MLYISLVLSLILLFIANVAVHRRRWWFLAFFLCGASFAVGLVGFGMFLPPVFLLFVALTVALLPWYRSNRRPWLFLPASCLAAVVAFGIVAWSVVKTEQQYAQLRRQFPYENMEQRLPFEPVRASRPLPVTADAWLSEIEGNLVAPPALQRLLLERLHEQSISLFINSPGFGVARTFPPTEGLLKARSQANAPVPQPEPRLSSGTLLDDGQGDPEPPGYALEQTHQDSVMDFANPMGFGYFKDRRHVAGFQPHQFSRLPKATERWSVRRVDLVGLLMHREPLAYVSANLPRMDELRKAPTRALDRFESSALEKLRKGEDLVVGSAGERLWMLGAIRSAKQCVECHGGERGDLLGAFSYALQRVER